MKLKDGVGTTVLENHYTFDLIGNILSMENVAGVIPGSQLGGPSLQSYGYDQFNRLATATGSWTGSSNAPAGSNQSAEYSLGMDYGPMHRILGKTQNHELDGNVQEANSYANQYEYQVSDKPNAVSRISRVVGGQTQEELFDYDANGNAVSHTFGGGAVGEDRMMLWDETNMMKAIRMGELSFYHNIYDGTGARVMKGIGDIDVMTVGGQQQLSATTGNYTVYVSPYVTINAHGMLSKHYYAGDDKLATRLAGEAADFDSGTPLSGQNTGSLAARQEDDLQHVYDEFGLGTVDIENLPPAMDHCESQGDCAQVLYYYHKDHIGSSSMVTDGTGAVYQYLMYLPFGESMAEQKLGGYSSRYRFTGKELDPLSGLYDFGARYYDPRLSVWFGVDPLAEKYPAWSPFSYTLNNPIRFTDPTGMGVEGDIYNNKGVHIGNDGKVDDKVYVKLTTDDTQMSQTDALAATTMASTTTGVSSTIDITGNTGITHSEFVQYAANVNNEAPYESQDEKDKVGSAINNRKETSTQGGTWQRTLDRIMFSSDTHEKKMQPDRANPKSGNVPGTKIPMSNVGTENYQNFINASTSERNASSSMTGSTKAAINGLIGPDKVKGANMWYGLGQGNGNHFYKEKKK